MFEHFWVFFSRSNNNDKTYVNKHKMKCQAKTVQFSLVHPGSMDLKKLKDKHRQEKHQRMPSLKTDSQCCISELIGYMLMLHVHISYCVSALIG